MNPQFKLLLQAVLKYLSIRDRSWCEIDQYLIRQQADPYLAQDIKDYLAANRLVDDQSFGLKWAEYRLSHNKGDLQILYDLKQKGLADSLSREIVKNIEFSSWEAAMDQLIKKNAAKFKSLAPYQTRAKTYQLLSQHGFSAKLIDAFRKAKVE